MAKVAPIAKAPGSSPFFVPGSAPMAFCAAVVTGRHILAYVLRKITASIT
jgi:hypothetical protein